MYYDASTFVYLDLTVVRNSSYTAPKNGFYIFSAKGDGSNNAIWYLDSDRTVSLLNSVTGSFATLCVGYYLKEGTTLYTRDMANTTHKVVGYQPL